MSDIVHGRLPCALEYGVNVLPNRHVVSFQVRVFAGTCYEPAEQLGIARMVEETIDKGTRRHGGRVLSDCFDAIGAGRQSGTGRESITFTCTVLPEHFERAFELHAEFLTEPTFPNEAVDVSLELARQELLAIEDDPQGLLEKKMGPLAFGPTLGRHPLGEQACLDRMNRDTIENYWKRRFRPGRMSVAVAGPIEPDRVKKACTEYLPSSDSAPPDGREPLSLDFHPGLTHHDKPLEQEQMAICWPGVDVVHDDFPIQIVLIGVLSGGMSGRLFTEVREKLGLVYWVSAWHETPRGCGLLFLGASTTPDRCDQTFSTLLREVNRLSEDLTEEELNRAVTGIIASRDTRGDGTRARCAELASDLFFYGRPVPMEEKIAKLQAVTVRDVHRFLEAHPRNQLCIMTLGPRALKP